MGMREDFQETLRLIYQQTANQLEKFWRDKTGNLFTGNKINASALPVDGSTITVTAGPGGPVITAPGAHGGTVTSVTLSLPTALFANGGSTVTASGSLTDPLATQAANVVFAGPSGGGAATPTFRGLVPADIPSLDAAKIGTGTFTAARLPLATSSTPGAVEPDNVTTIVVAGVISATGSSVVDATPTTTGGGLIDQSPAGGHPRFLTTPRLGAASGVAPTDGADYLPSAFLPTTVGSVPEFGRWIKAGAAILTATAGWEGTAVVEPSVIKDGGFWWMCYRGGWSTTGLGLASCPLTSDPTVAANWTKYGSNPIAGTSGNPQQPTLAKFGQTYYLYYPTGGTWKARTAGTILGLAAATATTALATGGGVSQWANSAVIRDPDGTWRGLLEGLTSGAWRIYLITSTDGLVWAVGNGGSPLATLDIAGTGGAGGPCLLPYKVNGVYHLWYHNNGLPADSYHATSSDMITWTQQASNPVLVHAGTGFEIDQAVDPDVHELSNVSYLFYDGDDNGASTASIGAAHILTTLHAVINGAPASGGGPTNPLNWRGIWIGAATTYDVVVAGDTPLGWWRLAEASASATFADASGNAHSLTANTSETHAAGLVGAAGGGSGQTSTGAGFASSSSAAFHLSTFSYEVWVKGTATSTCKLIGTASGQLRIYMDGGHASFFNGTQHHGPVINDNAWHHLVMTQDNGANSLKCYCDGVLIFTFASTGAVSTDLEILRDNGSANGLAGTLTEPAVYPVVLTPTQITNHYNVGLAATAPTYNEDDLVTHNGFAWIAADTNLNSEPMAGNADWQELASMTGGMANPMTTLDDIIVGGSSGAPGRLAKGADGAVLTVDPSTHHVAWDAPVGTLELTDGITDLTGVTKITVSERSVGGTAGAATLLFPIYAPLMDTSGAYILDSLGAMVMARIN